MYPFIVITPARIYMDVLVTGGGAFCVVRPNMQFNNGELTHKEVAFAHRYVTQEGWVEYANGGWEPDPELSAFMDEMLEVSNG
jgi:hypothetical protein